VVDDGSTDETPSIVQSYVDRDPRFNLIRQQNAGTAGAYRSGINAVSSELLVICAADDLLLPEHLQVMDEFVRMRPGYEIYSCNGEFLYQQSGARRPVYWSRQWLHERSLSFEQVVEECFYSVGALFRREVYEATGGHRLGVYVDDYDFWLGAMARGARHRYTPRILSVHRVSDFQQSANLERSLESRIEVYQHLLSSESLSEDQRALVQASLVRGRSLVRDWPVLAGLEHQSRRLRSSVERTVR
jgi:glycosyltransferase involved in cell wall biosynthesis